MADPDDADLKARLAAGMERLRGKFIAGLPARAEQLTVALAQENRGEQVRLVHQLAGAAASFGMEALAERARALELALTANAEKIDALPALIADLARGGAGGAEP